VVLANAVEFALERDAEIFASVPAAPAVFLLRGSDPAAEPYVSKTANLRRRLIRLLGAPEGPSRRLSLRGRVAHIEYSLTGSDFESGFLLYKALRELFPKTYQQRLRFRPAPLVRFHLENRFPRVSVTTHLSGTKAGSVFYGPFASRAAAEKFANDSLDFFKIRRCVEELAPDPKHPGCVYSEMKMCLAPCFQGCTDEQYANETARVVTFFDTRGESLARQLAAERDKASEDLHFETAAAVHSIIEKLKPVLAQAPEIVHRIDRLSALMIQPSAEPDSVTLFRIERGCVAPPLTFRIARETPAVPEPGARRPEPLSMERRIQDALASAPPVPECSQQETEEHLAVLKRWYFRSVKLGELFFADDRAELPMRRVVRGVSRVFKGEKPTGDLSETTRDYWVNRGKASEMGTEH
jgi:excinuclease ABC subunit C